MQIHSINQSLTVYSGANTTQKTKNQVFFEVIENKLMLLKFFHKYKMLVLYLSLFVVAVNGYKSGAPVVACDSMTPGHNVEAQV